MPSPASSTRAQELFAASDAAFEDLGHELDHTISHARPIVAMAAGDFAAAERELRAGYEFAEASGENGLRSTTATFLAAGDPRAGTARGGAMLQRRRQGALAKPDDLLTNVSWSGVEARLLAFEGQLEDAEARARESVALADRTDWLNFRAEALTDLVVVLKAAGRADEASATAADALRLYEEKGNVLAAEDVRAELDSLAAV